MLLNDLLELQKYIERRKDKKFFIFFKKPMTFFALPIVERLADIFEGLETKEVKSVFKDFPPGGKPCIRTEIRCDDCHKHFEEDFSFHEFVSYLQELRPFYKEMQRRDICEPCRQIIMASGGVMEKILSSTKTLC